jgi:16S rRNA processing protein RimM
VKFEGFDTREEAETLRGPLYVPGEDLRDLEAGEFWEHDVLGSRVVDPEGTELGRITGLERGPGQDRFVVETDRGERYVPVVNEIVVDIDVPARRVTIEPPDGLLD